MLLTQYKTSIPKVWVNVKKKNKKSFVYQEVYHVTPKLHLSKSVPFQFGTVCAIQLVYHLQKTCLVWELQKNKKNLKIFVSTGKDDMSFRLD